MLRALKKGRTAIKRGSTLREVNIESKKIELNIISTFITLEVPIKSVYKLNSLIISTKLIIAYRVRTINILINYKITKNFIL